MLGFQCCTGFSLAGKQGLLWVAVCWPLIVVTSLSVGCGLGSLGLSSWAPEHRLHSCGTQLSCFGHVRSSRIRGRTRVSCTGRRFFNPWATLDFPSGWDGKESACNAGDLGLIPGLGRSPGEGNGTLFSILAWRSPRTEEPGGLWCTGSQRVRHDSATTTFTKEALKALNLVAYGNPFLSFRQCVFLERRGWEFLVLPGC